MDKNQVIGFILLFAVLLIWSITSAPSEEELAARREQLRQDSIAQVMAERVNEPVAPPQAEVPATLDSTLLEQRKYSYGTFAGASVGEEENRILENEDIKITFNNKGGFIKEALLKKHQKVIKNEDGGTSKAPLALLEDPKNEFSYILPLKGPLDNIETKDLFFTSEQRGNELIMKVSGNSGEEFIQKFTLAESGYHLDYEISYRGLDEKPIEFRWLNYLDKLEKNDEFERRYSTVYYMDKEDEDTDYCSCASDDSEEFGGTNLAWISHSNQFFNTSLMANEGAFSDAILETTMLDETKDDLKILSSSAKLSGSGEDFKMSLYIGPNEYNNLKGYENNLEEIIPFGNSIFGSINRHFIRPFFNFLSKYIGSIGVVIIVLIFIIKMALYPLLYKMLYSQAKMGALKPELASLKEKFKDEPQKMQMEQMKIYREYGVSPLGGCLPMVIQMPIWYALFRFFPASITFRQKSFLWADDLSSYDVITQLPFDIPFFGSHLSLFTILWAISTVVYTYYNTKHMDMSANPAMKYVQYFMPIMFLAFFNSYASGLTCYMFFNNLINIAQTIVTKNFVFDEDKIRNELLKNKEKPKKKSKFASRLEEAMKKQQDIAAQQKNTKRRKK
jgi:YidC/Oxa1 family membrane protein insertase